MILRSAHLYRTRKHLLVTLLFVIAPFLFLYVYSHLSHVTTSVLFYDIFISFVRLFVAYAIAVTLGWLLAISFYHGKKSFFALPIFDVLQSFPTFAALPLAIYYWGPSTFVVIFFLVITIIWPILFSSISSLKLIRSDWEDVVRIEGITGVLYLKRFLWPVSIPGLITGSVIGLGEGWEALIATEMIVGRDTGLGSFFQAHSTQTSITAFGILGFLIIIFSINKLIWIPLMEWSHRTMEG